MEAPPQQAPFWSRPPDDVFRLVGSRPGGLTGAEVATRLGDAQAPRRRGGRRRNDVGLLLRQFESPIILILVVATILSGLLGDATDAAIILAIITLSGLLGFWQERGASRAVEDLMRSVEATSSVRRDGIVVQVPRTGVVPGDVVLLRAGDVVPGDGLVLESQTLLVDEAALTGEAYPIEKAPGVVGASEPIADRTNAVFFGTHVANGSGTALVVHTGAQTEFGKVSQRLERRAEPTGFELGMTAFGYLLLRVMIVLVVAIFVVNVALARPLLDAALFALALAVGLTPQLLPAIVTISLSAGARLMARQRVIVKRLDAIEDFGAMTILCTDKTGTMTAGAIQLHDATDLVGRPDAGVRRLACLNASKQAGFANPIDAALVAAGAHDLDGVRCLAEVAYDFTRRRLSVLVDDAGSTVMITKGALEPMLDVCASAIGPDGSVVPIDQQRAAVLRSFETLSVQGLRVLAVATRDLPGRTTISAADESGMTLAGLVTFLDPPRTEAAETIRRLSDAGISVRMITGDNRFIAAHVATMVGLASSEVLTGRDLNSMSPQALAAAVPDVRVFAEIDPNQKEQIIRAFRAGGRTVGFLGDGINDAPALHAADVGISVDTAVDVAKESAAIVLLDKDLRVLLGGVREGRRTFANTMKYVRVTTSANFGNMLSMAVASVVLPFLPLLPAQILLINFLTDLPSTAIATDTVDEQELAAPEGWNIASVRTFMLAFGIVSSAFDLLTFAVLRLGFGADEALFQSGWFVESVITELAVLFVLRTRGPFLRSRPSPLLLASSAALALLTVALPFSPLSTVLGLVPIPINMLLALLGVTVLYAAATELAKFRFYRSRDRRPAPVVAVAS